MKRVIDNAMIWKAGNSYVITVPIKLIDRFKLKVGDNVQAEIEMP